MTMPPCTLPPKFTSVGWARKQNFTSRSVPGIAQSSHIETEMEYVAFLNEVFLAFQAQTARIARAGFTLVPDVVVVGDGFSADKAALEVGVDHAGRLRRG